MTGEVYYGAALPEQTIVDWYNVIDQYANVHKDNMMARKLLAYHGLSSTALEYKVTKFDASAGVAKPHDRATPPQNFTVGVGQDIYQIKRMSAGFMVNEDEAAIDPSLYTREVQVGYKRIYRGEDYLFYNGDTTQNITGFKTAAEANSNGKVVASGASGSDTNNIGAWLTTDSNRDIYEDVRVGRGKIDAKFRGNNNRNLWLVGNSTSMDALYQKDPYSDASQPVWMSVAGLFGRATSEGPASFMFTNDYIDDNYVFIVAKDEEAAELVEAKPIFIDDDYPRQPIGNKQVLVYEDIGIAIHENDAFVELAIN